MTPKEAAIILGRKGGSVSSKAKRAASKRNGAMGGRPRKNKRKRLATKKASA